MSTWEDCNYETLEKGHRGKQSWSNAHLLTEQRSGQSSSSKGTFRMLAPFGTGIAALGLSPGWLLLPADDSPFPHSCRHCSTVLSRVFELTRPRG